MRGSSTTRDSAQVGELAQIRAPAIPSCWFRFLPEPLKLFHHVDLLGDLTAEAAHRLQQHHGASSTRLIHSARRQRASRNSMIEAAEQQQTNTNARNSNTTHAGDADASPPPGQIELSVSAEPDFPNGPQAFSPVRTRSRLDEKMFALLQRPHDFSRSFDHAILRLLGHVALDADAPFKFLIELGEFLKPVCAALASPGFRAAVLDRPLRARRFHSIGCSAPLRYPEDKHHRLWHANRRSRPRMKFQPRPLTSADQPHLGVGFGSPIKS
jgi:hypothetical protein